MSNHNEHRKIAPIEYQGLPLWTEGVNGSFDPFGSYTGLTEDPEEKPVQDADDL